MKKVLPLLLVFIFSLHSPSWIMAVEPTPRISDREIVERLTGLKERFEAVDKRFDDLRSEMNTRFDTIQWILSLFVTISLIILGFVLRMQWQMQKRQTRMETALETTKDELDFIKGIYFKLQDQITSLLKPPRGAL